MAGMRMIGAALLLAAALRAEAAQQAPTEAHVQQYRERLALYLTLGQSPEEVIASLTRYFPGLGVRFGIEVHRDGTWSYYVAIGHGPDMSYYQLLN